MPTQSKRSTLKSGLRLYRLPLAGTRAVTVLAAFDAGARTERPEENGIAHFLEHLVFKGGQKYSTYRHVNDTAERIGAVLNAYTSHEVVAFHVTVRAERVADAADLLSDFVGRPRLDGDELERERGVVVQEIARAHDQPSRVADDLIDHAAFGQHPLGRTVLGTAKNIRSITREQVTAFRRRRWGAAGAAVFLVGNLRWAESRRLNPLFQRIPSFAALADVNEPIAMQRRVLVRARDTNQSHLRLLWQSQIDPDDERKLAAFEVYATILGGSMGSRLFDEIREQRGLCYSIAAQEYVLPKIALLYVSSGLQSSKCVEAYARIDEVVADLTKNGPKADELERARAYASGKRILALESTGNMARYAARQVVVFGKRPDPERQIKALEAVKAADVAEVAASVAGRPCLACVGPHTRTDFTG